MATLLAPMKLESPFDDDLVFHSMSASEEISRLFELNIVATSAEPELDPQTILGQMVVVKLELADGNWREFSGHVTDFGLIGDQSAKLGYRYRIVARPWLWLLTRNSDCRIFQQKSIPDIIKEVFDQCGVAVVDDQLSGNYATKDYVVQYRETDFNFVSRLMEHEGIHYFFEHDGGQHSMVLADGPTSHQAVDGYETIAYTSRHGAMTGRDALDQWVFNRSLHSQSVTLRDFDFKRPGDNLESSTSTGSKYAVEIGRLYDYPGDYFAAAEGNQYSRTRIEESRVAQHVATGSGNVRGLTVGCLFALDGHPRDDQNEVDFLVLSTQTQIQLGSAESGGPQTRVSFTAMPATTPFRPQRLSPRPFVQGPQTAIVVGPAGDEIHTDEHGRVKVHFHWDRLGNADENDSCWIRVSHPWAGKGWGAVSIPRIGQEVIVDFLEGDPDRPIITGRVYNGTAKPAFPLPAAAATSGIRSNTHKGKGYNEMSMDDTAGKEKVNIHAQYDMATTVEHDDSQIIHNDRTIKVDGKHTETITKDTTIKIETGTFSHDVAANTATYHVKAALSENYDDTQTTKVKNNIIWESAAGSILIETKGTQLHIEAITEIQLHVGASTIKMNAAGEIKIDGVDITINGTKTVTTKAVDVTSSAGKKNEINGAIVLSDGSATNTVQGGMVMLNP